MALGVHIGGEGVEIWDGDEDAIQFGLKNKGERGRKNVLFKDVSGTYWFSNERKIKLASITIYIEFIQGYNQ